MELDNSKVEFSKVDLKQGVRIPSNITPELAYFVGLHIGDGSMNIYKHDHYMNISGHLIDEYDFYKSRLIPLTEGLFNKKVYFKKRVKKGHSMIRIQYRSKAILTFLNKTLGLPLGPKNRCEIPKEILKDRDLVKQFIKGLADTEFSLAFKRRHKNRHYYPVITYCTKDLFLIKKVYNLLKELGFSLHISYNVKSKSRDKIFIRHQLDLNGVKNLDLWMKEIGFNSSKHITKYLVWRKFGYCPSNTNIHQREAILKGKLDINKAYPKSL